MSEEPSTPGSNQPLSNEEMQTASAATPITPLSPDPTAIFMEAYDCAKNNHSWNKVSIAVSNHPEWLTRIPQGRRWTMLHQIVFCGSVLHLNEVLAYQISNAEFRLLCKALDDKTVREVASERAHVHPQMMRRIERLVAIDQLLNNAKDGKWDLVRQFLRQQPETVNEKPPYRKLYLAHYLASTGQLDMFISLREICQFKLDLIADNKSIVQIARQTDHADFAEYIENLQPNTNQTTEDTQDEEDTTPTGPNPPYPTSSPFFSQGFYDDPGIMIFSLNPNSFSTMFSSHDETLPHNNHHTDLQFATHSLYQGHNPATMATTTSSQNHNEHQNNKKGKSNIPIMTDDEQAEYEKTINENVKKFSADSLISAVTCCITKGILRDPVVAADGFTYEREAIMNWFEHSHRSPMTNQELESLELKPNHAIKSILQTLTEKSKSKVNGDDAK